MLISFQSSPLPDIDLAFMRGSLAAADFKQTAFTVLRNHELLTTIAPKANDVIIRKHFTPAQCGQPNTD